MDCLAFNHGVELDMTVGMLKTRLSHFLEALRMYIHSQGHDPRTPDCQTQREKLFQEYQELEPFMTCFSPGQQRISLNSGSATHLVRDGFSSDHPHHLDLLPRLALEGEAFLGFLHLLQDQQLFSSIFDNSSHSLAHTFRQLQTFSTYGHHSFHHPHTSGATLQSLLTSLQRIIEGHLSFGAEKTQILSALHTLPTHPELAPLLSRSTQHLLSSAREMNKS